MKEADVSTPSLDYEAMQPYWDNVSSVLGGTATMRKRKDLLPKFPNETTKDYNFRLGNARFTNVWRDIVENLAAKPFSQELGLGDNATGFDDHVENIDGEGSHLHVFGAGVFFRQLADALTWVFVDYPADDRPEEDRNRPRSVQEERTANLRPYAVHLSALDVIAVETGRIGGVEVITHLRFKANVVVRDGFKQEVKERIREYNREGDQVTYQVWELVKDKGTEKWQEVEGASGTLTIKEIPIVPFIGGRVASGFVLDPMLRDALDLQIDLFQQENGLKYAKDNTAFPMLAGNGVAPPTGADGKVEAIEVGPKSVLYAPPQAEGSHGEWSFIEPNANSLRFLADDIKATVQELRELGRQPLTAQTGNLTTVTTAFAAQKGNSAVQAAALLFKDAMENVLRLFSLWEGREDTAEVQVFTDFDVDLAGDQDMASLEKARDRRDISRKAYLDELKRRSVLGPEYDAEEDLTELLNDIPAEEDPSQDELDAIPGDLAA